MVVNPSIFWPGFFENTATGDLCLSILHLQGCAKEGGGPRASLRARGWKELGRTNDNDIHYFLLFMALAVGVSQC